MKETAEERLCAEEEKMDTKHNPDPYRSVQSKELPAIEKNKVQEAQVGQSDDRGASRFKI